MNTELEIVLSAYESGHMYVATAASDQDSQP